MNRIVQLPAQCNPCFVESLLSNRVVYKSIDLHVVYIRCDKTVGTCVKCTTSCIYL